MKKLIYILFASSILVGCSKEEQPRPIQSTVAKHAKWRIDFVGSDTTSFKVMLYSSTPPFMFVPYSGTARTIENEVVVGQVYAIQYRDTDNVVKVISHTVNDTTTICDRIPATIL